MPSPVGHVLAGVAAAWIVQAAPGPSRSRRLAARGVPLACALLAVAPDADIVLATHRAVSHSVGAVGVIVALAAAVARWRGWPLLATMAAAAAAFGSHMLLDWLGQDTSLPQGIMALWPFSDQYFVSGLDVFARISRRYWLPEQFIVGNAWAVAREVLILGPVAVLAWWWRRQASRALPSMPAPTSVRSDAVL